MKKMVRQRAPRVRRRGESSSDPYLEQRPPRTASRCSGCGAIYRNKRWQLDKRKKLAPFIAAQPKRTRAPLPQVLCPACRKVQDHYPSGVVTIHWPKEPAVREEILNLIKHQEEWGRQLNLLERVISMEAQNSTLTVTTTNERLAERIGRALERAFHGKVVYHWSQDDKFVRVEWAREAPAPV
jgi:hypothetical protein